MSELSDAMHELAETCERVARKNSADPSARDLLRTAARLAEGADAMERIALGTDSKEDTITALEAARALRNLFRDEE